MAVNPISINPISSTVSPTETMEQSQYINSLNRLAQQLANNARIPGGQGLESLSSANISQALSGQIDPSVLSNLGQQAAQRGVVTGSPTGPSTNAAYLKSLGLTSYDLMNQGQNWLTQAVGRNPAAPLVNAANFAITPLQQKQIEQANQELALRAQALEIQRQQANRPQLPSSAGGGGFGGGGYRPPVASSATNWPDLIPTPQPLPQDVTMFDYSPYVNPPSSTGSTYGPQNFGWEPWSPQYDPFAPAPTNMWDYPWDTAADTYDPWTAYADVGLDYSPFVNAPVATPGSYDTGHPSDFPPGGFDFTDFLSY